MTGYVFKTLTLAVSLTAFMGTQSACAEEIRDAEKFFNDSLRKVKIVSRSAGSKGAAETFSSRSIIPDDVTIYFFDDEEEEKTFTEAPPEANQFFDFGADETLGVLEEKENGLLDKVDIGGRVRVNMGYLLDHNAPSELVTHSRLKPEVTARLNDHWDIKASAMIDHFTENGSRDSNETDIRYDENYVRYARENFKITLGAQKAIWGRVDDLKPTDQLGSQDLRTFILDDYEDRRQAVPALRGEVYAGDYKIDGLFAFDLRAADLAERDSVWSFIDTDHGRIVFVPDNPVLAPVIQNATFGEDDGGIGGGGLRVSKVGEKADYAVTVQRFRQTLPFYEVNPGIIDAVEGGTPLTTAVANASGDTLTSVHPWSWLVGGDIAVPVEDIIFRAEGAWVSDMPTYTTSLRTAYVDSFQGVAGVEFYPGDGDLRVIMQAAANVSRGTDGTIGRDEIYSLNGSLEQEFGQARWAASLDYNIGLDSYDLYLNPKLSYKGWDSHTLYLEGHYFDGDPETLGGFFKRNSLLMAGWEHDF